MVQLGSKTALVTGSSRGIGRATALRLASAGAVTAVHSGQDADGVAETVRAIEDAGGRAFPVLAELGVPGDVDVLFEGLEAGLKEHADRVELDILVNNAAVLGTVAPEEVTPEHFDRLMAVNAKAPLFIVQRALPLMPDGGRIVNISTGLTRFANPPEVAHAMSKAALEMITLHFARHLGARGITVNTVAPGVVDTGDLVRAEPWLRAALSGLSAFGRLGRPEDISEVVAFLASPEARWVTGAWIDATGGTMLGQDL
ncbi:SDR family oxidoreductase [Amycolatopsis sp. SID8362]|uniref:SDR family oxidoreductase n=1 Tax=Amycolatopsis sp. SID8362 TaxID=2690346 RepID=UPI001368BB3F|nr:SDR family oxidoreductase [Amycolatopsis sp. SID8362]NBH03092.1 SDR family oxidoreductase [Amycolatopsis sp. SID8362]NED39793.1 SDR family oxidoreductase [Amycolatopsis sp. SID8362]